MTTEQPDVKVWCECGWSSDDVDELDWTGAKPTCPTCGAWAEVE
jgi:hypothetical protein